MVIECSPKNLTRRESGFSEICLTYVSKIPCYYYYYYYNLFIITEKVVLVYLNLLLLLIFIFIFIRSISMLLLLLKSVLASCFSTVFTISSPLPQKKKNAPLAPYY